MKYQFWQHKETGDVFAVRMNDDGKITGASGPLNMGSIQKGLLPLFVYFRSIGEFIANNAGEYGICEGRVGE